MSRNVKVLERKLTFTTNFHWNVSEKYTMVFEGGMKSLIPSSEYGYSLMVLCLQELSLQTILVNWDLSPSLKF